MAVYKITCSGTYCRATVHNYGCNFRCQGCTYKLRPRTRPERFPTREEIRECLRGLDIQAVHFMGGEPTTNPQLPDLLSFCKHELGVATWLGHTNGSGLIVKDLDGTNVSFKAFDEELHREYTGHAAAPLFENFRQSYQAGLELKASTVFIPDFGGYQQLEKIVRFVGGLDRHIPFHVMGYIPVPGAPWRRPTEAEMERAVAVAREHVETVTSSHLTPEQAVRLEARDDRFAVRQVL